MRSERTIPCVPSSIFHLVLFLCASSGVFANFAGGANPSVRPTQRTQRVVRVLARWFANGHGPASGSRRAVASASESKIPRIGGARKGRVRDRDDALGERRRNTEKAVARAANRVINDARSAPT